MFPTAADVRDFQAGFGPDAVVERFEMTRLFCFGTKAVARILPDESKAATLEKSWAVSRRMAGWLVQRTGDLPPSEKYSLIVEWSKATPARGEIFRIVGERDQLLAVAGSADWRSHEYALRRGWDAGAFP